MCSSKGSLASWCTKSSSMLGYGQNIQFDWNIHAFHKTRRKGKRNLPLVDQFVKPSKSAPWFI